MAAHKVHDACMEASKKIKELKPDIILLTTPHGVSLNEAYVLYGDAKAAGFPFSFIFFSFFFPFFLLLYIIYNIN